VETPGVSGLLRNVYAKEDRTSKELSGVSNLTGALWLSPGEATKPVSGCQLSFGTIDMFQAGKPQDPWKGEEELG
jgi:hypothetical protein